MSHRVNESSAIQISCSSSSRQLQLRSDHFNKHGSHPTHTTNLILLVLCILTLFSPPSSSPFTRVTSQCSQSSYFTPIPLSDQRCPGARDFVVDSVTGSIYAACNLYGVATIDTARREINTTVEWNQCLFPSSIERDSIGKVTYCACNLAGSMQRLDAIPTLTTIANCSNPQSVYRSPTTGVIYTTCFNVGVLSFVDGSSQLLLNHSQCAYPLQVRGDISGRIFVSCSHDVVRYDPPTNAITPLGAAAVECEQPNRIYVDPLTGDVLLACPNGIMYVDGSTLAVTTLLTSTQCPSPTDVLRTRRGVIIAACSGNGAIAYDGETITRIVTSTQCYIISMVEEKSGSLVLGCTDAIYTLVGDISTPVAMIDCIPLDWVYDNMNNRWFSICLLGGVVSSSVDGSFIQLLTSAECNFGSIFLVTVNGTSTILVTCTSGLWSVNPLTLAKQRLLTTDVCAGASDVAADSSSIIVTCSRSGIYQLDWLGESPVLFASLAQCDQPQHVYRANESIWINCNSYSILKVTGADMMQTEIPDCFTVQSIIGLRNDRLWIGCADQIISIDTTTSNVTTHYSCLGLSYAAFVNEGANGEIYAICSDKLRLFNSSTTELIYNCDGMTGAIYEPAHGSLIVGCKDEMKVITSDFKCFAGTYWSLGQCVPCPMHTYRSSSQIRSFGACQPCPAGYITTSTGSTQCTPCPIGTYEKNRICTLCLPGRYQPSVGSPECIDCPAGRAISIPGASECAPCLIGSYAANNGSVACLLCRPGEYQSHEGSTECELAQSGHYSDTSGSSEMIPCQPGTATAANKTITCAVCLPGYYQPDSGQVECLPCPLGQYAISPGSTQCQLCSPGFYTSSLGSSSCSPCVPGSASNVTGLSEPCEGCKPGYYQGGTGKVQCIECEPHTYSERSHSTSCTRCEAQVNKERTQCNTTLCPANTYYTFDGECEVCPLGTYSAAGGACTTCSINTYTPYEGSGCVSCQLSGMSGIVCSGGLASVKAGYWAYQSEVELDDDGGEDTSGNNGGGSSSPTKRKMLLYQSVPCPDGYCPGSQLQLAPSSSSSGSGGNNNGSITADIEYCRYPRLNAMDNILCSSCVSGYIPWGVSCVRCDGSNVPLLFGGLLLSFLFVIFLLQSGQSAAGPVSVLLFFIQISALEIGPISEYLIWLKVFNFDSNFSDSKCFALWSPYQQILFSLLVPIIFIVQLTLLGGVHYILYRRYIGTAAASMSSPSLSSLSPSPSLPPPSSSTVAMPTDGTTPTTTTTTMKSAVVVVTDDGSTTTTPSTMTTPNPTLPIRLFSRFRILLMYWIAHFSYDRYIGGVGSILLFCYTQVATTTISYLYCVDIGDEKSVMFSAPTVDCHSTTYRTYLIPVILYLIVYVIGLPLGITIALWRMKDRLWSSSSSLSSSLSSSSSSSSSLSSSSSSSPSSLPPPPPPLTTKTLQMRDSDRHRYDDDGDDGAAADAADTDTVADGTTADRNAGHGDGGGNECDNDSIRRRGRHHHGRGRGRGRHHRGRGRGRNRGGHGRLDDADGDDEDDDADGNDDDNVNVNEARATTISFAGWSPFYRMYHPRAWYWQSFVLIRRGALVCISIWFIQHVEVRYMAFTFLTFASLLIHLLVQPFQHHRLNRMENISYVLLVSISLLLTPFTPPYETSIQVILLLLVIPYAVFLTGYVIYQQWRDITNKSQGKGQQQQQQQIQQQPKHKQQQHLCGDGLHHHPSHQQHFDHIDDKLTTSLPSIISPSSSSPHAHTRDFVSPVSVAVTDHRSDIELTTHHSNMRDVIGSPSNHCVDEDIHTSTGAVTSTVTGSETDLTLLRDISSHRSDEVDSSDVDMAILSNRHMRSEQAQL